MLRFAYQIRLRWVLGMVLALVAVNAFVWGPVVSPRGLVVSVLPVGKGSAVLVRAPDGRLVLINAGGDASVLRALGTALPEWRRSFAAIVLTSMRAEAAGGAPSVLARYRAAEILRTEAAGSRTEEAALAPASATTRTLYPHAGDRYALGGGAVLDILWPPRTPAAMNGEDGFLVVRIVYGASSFVINEGLPERLAAAAEAGLKTPAVVIGTSTRAATYFSDGNSVSMK